MAKDTDRVNEIPTVLVSTIPSWSERSGANTFSTLLQNYPCEKIANIYFKADLPTSKVSSRYFQILENAVIKSIWNKNVKTGKEVKRVSPTDKISKEATAEKKRYSFFLRHRNFILLWGRELMWKLGKWKSKELNDYLSSIDPEVFIYHIQGYPYFNRINKYIIEKTKPRKVIAFMWDDCFSYKATPYNPISYINRYFLRKRIKGLIGMSDVVLSICPKMKKECDHFFKIKSELITKPILTDHYNPYKHKEGVAIRIVYSGSLLLGRDKTIIRLINCLREINKSRVRIYLDIYSQTSLTNKQLEQLEVEGISSFKGQIPQQDVFIQQEKADILLFVENLNNRFHNNARLSFSTKITDYLSRNRAILAIGPNNISSIEYLKNENAAIVCSNETEIKDSLKRIIENPQILEEYAQNAFSCGERNHSKTELLRRFTSLICE